MDARLGDGLTVSRYVSSVRRFFLAAMVLAGCGSAPPPPVVEPPPPRSVGSLESLVPAESRLVVYARPTVLMEHPATERVVRAVFDDEQMARYQARTGVDPRTLDTLVIAVVEEGTIILARGMRDADFAVREAGERMAPMEASVDEPFVRRAGFIGARRADMAALDPHTIAWIDGTPQLAAAVLAAANLPEEEREHRLTAHVELRAEVADAPFAVLAPQPLGLPIDSGIGLLLAREEAMVVAVRGARDRLRVQADLAGEFPPGAVDNFRAFAESMAASDLGAALGARDALPTLTLEVSEEAVRARAEVDPAIVAAGLRAVLMAEMRELIDGVPLEDNPPESQD